MLNPLKALLASASIAVAVSPVWAAQVTAPLVGQIAQSNVSGDVPSVLLQSFPGSLTWDDDPAEVIQSGDGTAPYLDFDFSLDAFGTTVTEADGVSIPGFGTAALATSLGVPQEIAFNIVNPAGVEWFGAAVTQIRPTSGLITESNGTYFVDLRVNFESTPDVPANVIPLPASALLLLGGLGGFGVLRAARKARTIDA